MDEQCLIELIIVLTASHPFLVTVDVRDKKSRA